MSSLDSRLMEIHEKNKRFLEQMFLNGTEVRNNQSINIIHVDQDLLLLDYIINRITYRYLRVRDSSTQKFHFLSIPNNIRNCKIALAWTFGMEPAEYDLGFET